MFDLDHQIAVVTGAASGIGRAIAERFRTAGARVLSVDRRPQPTDPDSFIADVSIEDDVAAMLEEAQRRFGRVDILVNNAGIQPLGVTFAHVTGPLLDRTFGVNVHSVAFGIKHASRLLTEGGSVINLASFVGAMGVPGAAVYGTSKAAVIHLTKLGALELAPRRITVNSISPGTILTPAVTSIRDNPEIPFMERRTPLGRLGLPEEVAALCQFLASPQARYITGQNIGIDGGVTAGWMEYELDLPANIQNGRWNDDV